MGPGCISWRSTLQAGGRGAAARGRYPRSAICAMSVPGTGKAGSNPVAMMASPAATIDVGSSESKYSLGRGACKGSRNVPWQGGRTPATLPGHQFPHSVASGLFRVCVTLGDVAGGVLGSWRLRRELAGCRRPHCWSRYLRCGSWTTTPVWHRRRLPGPAIAKTVRTMKNASRWLRKALCRNRQASGSQQATCCNPGISRWT